jgi:aspartate--ammonia ligase
MADKRADLAGPGIGSYEELEHLLPRDYHSLLTLRETQQAIFAVKHYIEKNLCRELNLLMVTVPLIVDVESGVNDMLDRDGARMPIQFHVSNDHDKHPVNAQVVQAARTDVHGYPGQRGNAPAATRNQRPAGLPQAPLPPGHLER